MMMLDHCGIDDFRVSNSVVSRVSLIANLKFIGALAPFVSCIL